MTSPDAGLPRNIGAPATCALTVAGYSRLGQLANVPAAELVKLHGVGPKALRLPECPPEIGAPLTDPAKYDPDHSRFARQ